MEELEQIISNIDNVKESVTERAELTVNQILAHQMVEKVYIDGDELNVILNPIELTCVTNETLTVNLGKMRINVRSDGGYGVFAVMNDGYRDDRITGYIEDRDRGCHPHVSSDGSLCLGNVIDIPTAASDKDLPMLVACLIEFLQTYYKFDTFWEPFVFIPCEQCEYTEGSNECMFCKCTSCGARDSDGRCSVCEKLGVLSGEIGAYKFVDIIHNTRSCTDEDDFVEMVMSAIPIFKKE